MADQKINSTAKSPGAAMGYSPFGRSLNTSKPTGTLNILPAFGALRPILKPASALRTDHPGG